MVYSVEEIYMPKNRDKQSCPKAFHKYIYIYIYTYVLHAGNQKSIFVFLFHLFCCFSGEGFDF